jgi:hypothetical protein
MALSKAQRLAIQLAAYGIVDSKGINLPEHLLPGKKKRKPPTPLPDHCLLLPGPPGRWEVMIEGWFPYRLNQLLSAHKYKRGKMKYEDAQVIGQALREAGVSRATGKRRLQYVIVLAPKQRGADGDAFDKSLRDGLKRAGAIKDDNRQWLDAEKPLYERAGVKGIRVILEDCE